MAEVHDTPGGRVAAKLQDVPNTAMVETNVTGYCCNGTENFENSAKKIQLVVNVELNVVN